MRGGPHKIVLRRSGNDIVADFTALNGARSKENPEPAATRVVVLSGVREIRIGYFGAADARTKSAWRADWTRAERLRIWFRSGSNLRTSGVTSPPSSWRCAKASAERLAHDEIRLGRDDRPSVGPACKRPRCCEPGAILLRRDWTVAHHGQLYQVQTNVRATHVMVEDRVDGTMRMTHKGRPLDIPGHRRASAARAAASQDRAPTAPGHADTRASVAQAPAAGRNRHAAAGIT